MEQPRAQAGQSIHISSILFNDTDNVMHHVAPKRIVLQWHGDHGAILSSIAYRESGNDQTNIPVNSFVRFSWRTTVPSGVTGIQAVRVQGQSTAMAVNIGSTSTINASGTTRAIKAGLQPPQPVLPDSSQTDASLTHASQVPVQTDKQPAPVTTPPSAFDNFRSAISSFEPVYFDIGSKGDTNARFQLSFKYRLFNPADPQNPAFIDNLYLGYTQTSLWDLEGDSMPFVDTTYNPSLFWRKAKLWETNNQRWFAGLSTGVEHMSNGKGGEDSRSLNDAFIQPELNYRFDNGSTLTFSPRIKAYFVDNQNPDYVDYMGRVDWKLRWAQDNGLVLTGLYQQGHHGRHAVQLDAAWPLQRTFLNMNGYLHVQFYEGYGETLLGYREKSDPQVRIGLSLVP